MSADEMPVTCAVCGASGPPGAKGAPAGWMTETDPGRGTVWVCPSCVRENVRSIEARLDQQWW